MCTVLTYLNGRNVLWIMNVNHKGNCVAFAAASALEPLVKRPTNLAKAFNSTNSLSGSAGNLRTLVSPGQLGRVDKQQSNASDGAQTSDDESAKSHVHFDLGGDPR